MITPAIFVRKGGGVVSVRKLVEHLAIDIIDLKSKLTGASICCSQDSPEGAFNYSHGSALITRLTPRDLPSRRKRSRRRVLPISVAIGEEVIHLSLQWQLMPQSSRLR